MELKPCPFCGGAPKVHVAGHRTNVECQTITCAMRFVWPAVEAWNHRAIAPEGRNGLATEGFYLQDRRHYDGNDMFWWAKNGNGYTTDLRKAHVYSAEQAARGMHRETDIFWPVAYINELSRPTVDMQYAKKAFALPPPPDATEGKV